MKATYNPNSPWPFNITGKLLVLSPGPENHIDGLDLTDTIVFIGNYSMYSAINTVEYSHSLIKRISKANGMGVIAVKPEPDASENSLIYVMTASYLLFPIPYVAINRTNEAILRQQWNESSGIMVVTLLSDDFTLIQAGQIPAVTFFLSFTLACAVASFGYVGHQIYLFRAGSSFSKIALICCLISNSALIIERSLMLSFFYTTTVPFPVITLFIIAGVFFTYFAASYIGIYWASLVFTDMKVEMNSKLAFWCLLAYYLPAYLLDTFGNAFYLPIAYYIEIVFLGIAGLLATFFVVVGAKRIYTLQHMDSGVIEKRKTNRRLIPLILVTGFCIFAILLCSIIGKFVKITGDPIGTATVQIVTRCLLVFFTVAANATISALFKRPKQTEKSAEAMESVAGKKYSREPDVSTR
eukprot:TRINITY_DN15334_c0_g1_i1.p1 TRINITY_DN15334_c0_g1~~TRINITY_DN15334_c0_g1_i1.p1  ORF type:complete len:465 (-),score=7.58 TRINITY_DN15334_c0_g1_i1:134-1366(-)